MNKLKARHLTEAAKPQGKVLLAGFLILALWMFSSWLFT